MTFGMMSQAVKSRSLPQSSLDRAAANVLRSKFAAGLFDRPLASTTNTSNIDTPISRALARKVVAEGSVLLQNVESVTTCSVSTPFSSPKRRLTGSHIGRHRFLIFFVALKMF